MEISFSVFDSEFSSLDSWALNFGFEIIFEGRYFSYVGLFDVVISSGPDFPLPTFI